MRTPTPVIGSSTQGCTGRKGKPFVREAAQPFVTPCYTMFQDEEEARALLSGEHTAREHGLLGGTRARWLLADRASRVLSEARGASTVDPTERVVRLAVPVEPVEPFRWLRGQSLSPKLYWAGREDGFSVAAV